MGAEAAGMVRPPSVSPLNSQNPEIWKHFDDSVNAASFGFVATAILVSMFLLLAIFEKFLRQRLTESTGRSRMDLEEQMDFGGKPENPSPKLDDNLLERRVSVDAWRANSYIHCTPCFCTMSPRVHLVASSSQPMLPGTLDINDRLKSHK